MFKKCIDVKEFATLNKRKAIDEIPIKIIDKEIKSSTKFSVDEQDITSKSKEIKGQLKKIDKIASEEKINRSLDLPDVDMDINFSHCSDSLEEEKVNEVFKSTAANPSFMETNISSDKNDRHTEVKLKNELEEMSYDEKEEIINIEDPFLFVKPRRKKMEKYYISLCSIKYYI